jgi:hypothetical protein
VAEDQVVGVLLGQPAREGFEGLAAVAGAGDDGLAADGDAAFVLDGGTNQAVLPSFGYTTTAKPNVDGWTSLISVYDAEPSTDLNMPL